ncbi:MAG TPA: DUF4267 domain-containing protein [Acidimicrobiales bacterium]|nr:DUF4267 domain-containing protein [Acidimicrobiales bacterium]
MNDDLRRRIPHLIAVGRIAFGLGLMATPSAGAMAYLGAEAKRPSVRFMSRIFGGRDLALGIVLLRALREDRPESVTSALLLGAGCDAWDAVAAVRARDLPIWGRIVVAMLGSAFAALGISAALTPSADLAAFSAPTSASASGATSASASAPPTT